MYDEDENSIANPVKTAEFPVLSEESWRLVHPDDYEMPSRQTATQYIQLIWNGEGYRNGQCMRHDTAEGEGLILGGCQQGNKPNTVNLYLSESKNGGTHIGGAWETDYSCLRPNRDIVGPSSCLEMSSTCEEDNQAIEWVINAKGNNEIRVSPLSNDKLCIAGDCACELGGFSGRKFCLVECVPGSQDQSFTIVPVNQEQFEGDKFVLVVLRDHDHLCVKAHPAEFADVVLANCDKSDPEQVFYFERLIDQNGGEEVQWVSGSNPELCIEPVQSGFEQKLRLYHCSANRDKQRLQTEKGGNIHIKKDLCVAYDSCYTFPSAGINLEAGLCQKSGEFDLVKLEDYRQ